MRMWTPRLRSTFVNTASCKSSNTFIGGGRGILQYRDYSIEQLAAAISSLPTQPFSVMSLALGFQSACT